MVSGLGIDGNWIGVLNTDPRAVALYERHYSARPSVPTRTRLKHGISGPGELMTLITVTGDALFVWQNNLVDRYDHQDGVNCSVFRNEGGGYYPVSWFSKRWIWLGIGGRKSGYSPMSGTRRSRVSTLGTVLRLLGGRLVDGTRTGDSRYLRSYRWGDR